MPLQTLLGFNIDRITVPTLSHIVAATVKV